MNKTFLFFTASFLLWATGAFAQLSMKKTDEGILITENKKEVFLYHIHPKDLNGQYRRCNYIHPLYGLNGEVLTEDFPSDHLHHRGIFWAWHQVWIGDKRVSDGWEIKDFDQTVTEIEFKKNPSGLAVIKTEVDWTSGKWKKEGKKVPYLNEKTTITVHPTSRDVRKIDFEIQLLALEEGLKLGGSEDEKAYGGFSVRLDLPDDVTFSGPDGKIEPENTAVKSSGYVQVSGTFDNGAKESGVVIVDHPQNPGYPQDWILRAKNSMQNVVWPGREPVIGSTTEPLVLKYSLLVYSGKMNNNKMEKIIGDDPF
ncbi:PmoA family protein [Maribellus sp. YY47]|uniref:DUF6807 domain-containing protein n=1 Tax=Maribellus sp. YY47 TaxID=2929486 RepID=UPI0020006454|nr:PmoA family protein [Maribellus sp. YY47]MCK3685268.1 PmoA family protein [Maribellus sp. YY47]